MTTHTTQLTQAKAQAKRLSTLMGENGQSVPLARAYEMLAQSAGFADWNTMSAQLQKPRAEDGPAAWQLGGHVRGRYLGQPFEGRIHGLRRKGATLTEIEIQLDQPINVSRSALFEAPRRRIRSTIAADGRSVSATSDGVPHLVLA
ncbi:glyoxalase superfamily protein [Gemmobacter serpentinus]|uniref:glyoxalase superfamily protein n=1 Tax=Gemmobacter serpentinus TaxID=2652247 RepID=UPI00124CF2A5|nr:glyoxalase superfamily protein [Gemmobacter serpentinus]